MPLGMDEMQQEIEVLTAQRDAANQRADANYQNALEKAGLLTLEQRAFEQFKNRVRDTAIEVAKEQGWCKNGLNETLKELGLKPVAPERFVVKGSIEYELVLNLEGHDEFSEDENAVTSEIENLVTEHLQISLENVSYNMRDAIQVEYTDVRVDSVEGDDND